jgi:hypothetical protein
VAEAERLLLDRRLDGLEQLLGAADLRGQLVLAAAFERGLRATSR